MDVFSVRVTVVEAEPRLAASRRRGADFRGARALAASVRAVPTPTGRVRPGIYTIVFNQ